MMISIHFDFVFRWYENWVLRKLADRFRMGLGERALIGDGVSFRLQDTPIRDVYDVVFEIELPRFPPHLELECGQPHGYGTHHLSGDEDFDDLFCLRTDRPEESLAYLTSARRALLVGCLEDLPNATIRHQRLRGSFRFSPAALAAQLPKLLELRTLIANPPSACPRETGIVNRHRKQRLALRLGLTGLGWLGLAGLGALLPDLVLAVIHADHGEWLCLKALAALALCHGVAAAFILSKWSSRRFWAMFSLNAVWLPFGLAAQGWLLSPLADVGVAIAAIIVLGGLVYIDGEVARTHA